MTPQEAAAVAGTPVYLYDVADVRAAHGRLRRALPAPHALYYSLKANPHPDVAAVLGELGCRAEVSSTGEIDVALAAGFPPDRLLMTGPGKTAAAIAYALRRSVRRFSVDSPGDLTRIGAVSGDHGAECLLRVNATRPVAGMALTMTGTASPFGADASWIIAEPELFRGAGGAVVTGLHFYLGSGVTEEQTLVAQLAASAELAGEVLAALALEAVEVDLGGGFGMPYARRGGRPAFSGLAAGLSPVLDTSLPGWRATAPLVTFESGRYLAGGAGTLVCRVVDVKRSQGRTFVVLDSGAHHLGGMPALRRLPRVVPDVIPAEERGGRMTDCVVAGPLCTPLDTWSDGVTLPRLCPGDLVSVPNVGAYGLTASLIAFLGHPPPVEVVVDGERVVSTSRLTLGRATQEVSGG